MSGIAKNTPAAQRIANLSVRTRTLQDPHAHALLGNVGACSTCQG